MNNELEVLRKRVEILEEEKEALLKNMKTVVNSGTTVRLALLRCEKLLRQNGIKPPEGTLSN